MSKSPALRNRILSLSIDLGVMSMTSQNPYRFDSANILNSFIRCILKSLSSVYNMGRIPSKQSEDTDYLRLDEIENFWTITTSNDVNTIL